MMPMTVEHLDATPEGMWPIHIRGTGNDDDGSVCLLHAAADRDNIERLLEFAYYCGEYDGERKAKSAIEAARKEGWQDGYEAARTDEAASTILESVGNPWITGDGSLSPAELCRQHGWKVGDTIVVQNAMPYPRTITAIGKEYVFYTIPCGDELAWTLKLDPGTKLRRVSN